MAVNDADGGLDRQIRAQVYDDAMQSGLLPSIMEIAARQARAVEDVRASLQRLAAGHILVLQKETGEILMANPISAVPTPFRVNAGQHEYYGNCIWDAMGIPAMLKQDAFIQASCSCCGTAMSLEIKGGSLQPASGLAHFAIPAAHWWDDVVFT
jgi:hypothetical protein